MPQEFTIYNRTRRELLRHVSGIDAGLMAYVRNPLCSAAMMLLLANSNGYHDGDIGYGLSEEVLDFLGRWNGRWAGHRIVIQGSSADKEDDAYLTPEAIGQYRDITDELYTALETAYPNGFPSHYDLV